jgi:hypothetical protein
MTMAPMNSQVQLLRVFGNCAIIEAIVARTLVAWINGSEKQGLRFFSVKFRRRDIL